MVSGASGLLATALHKQVGQWVLLALVLLHVAAIAYYRIVRRRPLVKAMVDGDKLLPRATLASRDDATTRTMAGVLFVLCVMVVSSAIG
jgi:cytochrome b